MGKRFSVKGFDKDQKCNVFCFIDDLNAINNAGKYESNFTDIYPEELELCRQNGSNAEATFLDLDIKIKIISFK